VWALVQVAEGEFVYYPRGYWHQTENVDAENIAVSSSTIDSNDAESLEAEIRKECNGVGTSSQRFAFSHDVCDVMKSRVFPWWRRAYLGSFDVGGSNGTCRVSYRS
jgi:hypothetical protein